MCKNGIFGKIALGAAFAASLLMTACSSAGTSNSPAVTGTASEQTEMAAANGDEIKGTGETLIIYSNSVSDGRGDWLKERAAEDGFSIEYVDIGGGELENRLIAEKNNPIADVVYGLNTMVYERFKGEELLEQYIPVWADEITPGLNDPEGYYHALVKQAIVLIYNSELYNEETAPQDWPDLWNNEAFHGLYEVQSGLAGSTVRNVIAGILVRYTDPDGELGISPAGWSEIEKFFAYGVPSVSGEEFYAKLASGELPFGQMWSSGIDAREVEYGVKAGIVNPEIGVPYAVEQITIIKGTKKLEEAKRFVDWFGQADIQGEWAQLFSSMPANENAMSMATEENVYISENYRPQDIDWSFVSDNIDAWCEKITLEYMK